MRVSIYTPRATLTAVLLAQGETFFTLGSFLHEVCQRFVRVQ